MAKIYYLLLLMPMLLFGQKAVVTDIRQIAENEEIHYSFPKFGPEGKSIYFSGANYRGLWAYDLETDKIEKIIDARGAGYEPAIYANAVIYRSDEYIDGRRYSALKSYDLNSGRESTLMEKTRHLYNIGVLSGGAVIYRINGDLSVIRMDQGFRKVSSTISEPYLINENAMLIVVKNGLAKKLSPLGEGNYVWGSLSPDQSKIVFTVAGRGTYITDLDGNVITELGYANAPQWSPDGNWIVYMDDRDDGHRYISSDIYVSTIDGQSRFKLTGSEHIAMHPVWSADGKHIAYHTDAGEIYLLGLKTSL